jgi:hypothetical protein
VKGRGGREEKIEQESHARGTKDEAEAKLRDHFTNRLGYKISSMKHMGVVKEEVEAVAEGSEDVDLDEAAIKVGDTVVWNKGKTAQTVGVVHKIETDHYIVHHTRTNTYHKLPKQGSELVESVDLSEATDKTSQRLVQLVRFGLMDKSKLPLLTRAMASLDKGSVSNPSERQVLFELLDDLIGIVTGDDSTFSKIKMQVQK